LEGSIIIAIDINNAKGHRLRRYMMVRGLPAAGLFFFSSWLTMIFWGIIAPDLGGRTISYPMAMLITIAVWLVVAPLAAAVGRGGKKWGC